MKHLHKVIFIAIPFFFFALYATAQVNLSSGANTYTQDFNGLPSTGTTTPWADNVTIPGWVASNGTAAVTTLSVGDGTGTTGAIWDYGFAGINPVTDRTLGILSSSTFSGYVGLRLKNNDATQKIQSITVTYTGEQFRRNTTAGTLQFGYRVGAVGLNTGVYTLNSIYTFIPNTLDFPAAQTGAVLALDGNDPLNRATKTATITVTVNPGEEIWLRWQKTGSNSSGLGLDDISITANYCSSPTCAYCNFDLNGGCSASITNVNLNTLSNASAACSALPTNWIGNYTSFAPTGAATTTLTQTIPYTINLTSNSTLTISSGVWIDYNQNGVFEAAEFTVLTGAVGAASGTINIPLTALTGQTAMRIRSRTASIVGTEACAEFASGETEDYIITIAAATPCSGPPPSGTASATASSACGGSIFTLNFAGASTNSAITYQWQSSPIGANTWTNIGTAGPTPVSLNQTITTVGLDYRLQSTCTTTSDVSNSNVVTVTLNAAAYTSIPYNQSFENNWVNTCATRDVPDNFWRNTPITTDSSWRRDDDGASAGWTSLSSYAYTPAGSDGIHSARFHSANVSITSGPKRGKLDLFIDASSQGPAGFVYAFDYINTTGNDSVTVLYSTDGGVTFTRVDSVRLRATWTTKSVVIPTNSATTVVRLQAWADFGSTDIGVDNIRVSALCSGTPTAGTSAANPASLCVGANFTLSLTGVTNSADLTYQWQSSAVSANTFTNIAGATANTYTSTFTVPTDYRCVVTCPSSTLSANSTISTVGLILATYATIPFVQNFENAWINKCNTRDVPTNEWLNTPATGNTSWRRNDDAVVGGWTSTTFGAYTPAASNGLYSARFHSYSASSGAIGRFDLFINASSQSAAGFGVAFDYINTSGSDSLVLLYSADGGSTFTRIDSIKTRSVWTTKLISVPTNSATTVLRFQAYGDFGTTDIGVDSVRTVFSCTGTPSAGTISAANNNFCAGNGTTLTLAGHTTDPGIVIQWQSSTDGGANWTNVGTNSATYNTGNLNLTTTYQAIVTCTNSGFTSFSPSFNVTVKPIPSASASNSGPVCLGGNINLTGTTNIGTTYVWTGPSSFTSTTQNPAISSATLINSGTYSFTTSLNGCTSLAATTNVIVNQIPNVPIIAQGDTSICAGSSVTLIAKSNADTVRIGNGVLVTSGNVGTSGLGPNPLQTYYGGTKTQIIMTQTELSAAGVLANVNISSLALFLATADPLYTLNNLTIKVGNTTKIQFGSTASTEWVTTGLTTVYTNASYSSAVGANVFALSTPFTWSGSGSLLIEISYSNNNGGNPAVAAVFNTALHGTTTNTTTLFYRADNATAASMLAYAGTASYAYTNRNNIRFGYATPIGISWSPATGLFTDALLTTPYVSGASSPTVYAAPTGNTTYTATANNNGCTSTSANVNVSITVAGTWLGKVSNDWHNPANWCGGVPTATTVCIIPATAPNMPTVLAGATATCKTLTVVTGAIVTVDPTAVMNIVGN